MSLNMKICPQIDCYLNIYIYICVCVCLIVFTLKYLSSDFAVNSAKNNVSVISDSFVMRLYQGHNC